MIERMTFDRDAILAALNRLNGVLKASGKKSLAMKAVIRQARDERDEAVLRMAFTLSQLLKSSGNSINAVAAVNYKRLDGHRHEIEIVAVGEMN